jgi:hypothetical protein
MRHAISHFPARRLTSDEHSIVIERLASAVDIASAYISNRRGDDPTLHHRIITAPDSHAGPSHFIHAPGGRNIWIVFSSGWRTRVRRFRTLRAAFNSIRPVLVEAGSRSAADIGRSARKPKAAANEPKPG